MCAIGSDVVGRMRKVSLCILLLLCAIAFGYACYGEAPDSSSVQGTGTIQYMDVEGGFYAISSDDGAGYDPTNLATGFQRDGLRVRFEGKLLGNVSIHQWGKLIELTSIEAL